MKVCGVLSFKGRILLHPTEFALANGMLRDLKSVEAWNMLAHMGFLPALCLTCRIMYLGSTCLLQEREEKQVVQNHPSWVTSVELRFSLLAPFNFHSHELTKCLLRVPLEFCDCYATLLWLTNTGWKNIFVAFENILNYFSSHLT